MAKDDKTADLFEADGVTPKVLTKPVITEEQLAAEKRASEATGEAKGLREALKAIPVTKEKPQIAKEFTRAELRAKVNAGEITEDQMDETLETQLKASLTKAVRAEVRTEVAASQTGTKVGDQIAAYVDVYPDINKEGSATRTKIQAAFDELVTLGDKPDALTTELKAIKMALGPLKASAGRRPAPDAHEEIGGAGGDGSKPDTDGWAKGLSGPQKKHYEKLVGQGIYKGFTDPKLVKEISFARKAH